MQLDEALEILKNNFYLVEDTDELDDADLPAGWSKKDKKAYHKQKAKFLKLEEKIQLALNNQLEKRQEKLEAMVSPEVKKLIKSLQKQHKEVYSGDSKGDWFLHQKNIDQMRKSDEDEYYRHSKIYKEKDAKLKTEEDRLLEVFRIGFYKRRGHCGYSSAKDNFLKHWIPRAQKLMNGQKLRVYRGLHLSKEDLKNKTIVKSITDNLLDRNSWTFNRDVAVDYAQQNYFADEAQDCFIVISMDCDISQTNLYYSAWLEGYWYGYGSQSSKVTNDEINLKQMLKVTGVKIDEASSSKTQRNLFNKYFKSARV